MGSRDPLQLELGLPSSIVAGEFVVATLELTNASAGSVTVAGRRGLRGGDLWFKITDPQPGRAHAIGRFGLHGNGEAVRLAPGEQLRWGVNLSCPQFGLAFDDFRERRRDVFAPKRLLTRQHLEQHDTIGPNVRALVDGTALGLLG